MSNLPEPFEHVKMPSRAEIVTSRELAQNPGESINQLRANKSVGILTFHGRMTALIVPLAPGAEATLIEKAIDSGGFVLDPERSAGMSVEQMVAQLRQ